MTPAEALRALQEGNERHLAGQRELRTYSPLGEHAMGQQPFAACPASRPRRPPEPEHGD